MLHGEAYTRFVPGRGSATRTSIVRSRGLPPSPCPILHKQEATGSCRRLIRSLFRNQIWSFLCPAQDSWVPTIEDRRRPGLRRIVDPCIGNLLCPACAHFGGQGQLLNWCLLLRLSSSSSGDEQGARRTTSEKLRQRHLLLLLLAVCPLELQRSRF